MDNTRALEALQFVVVQTSEFQAKLAAALAAHVAGGELVPVVHAEDDVMPAATGKKRKAKGLDADGKPKPKRAPTDYNVWMKWRLAKTKREQAANPDVEDKETHKELFAHVAHEWKSLDADVRAKQSALARKELNLPAAGGSNGVFLQPEEDDEYPGATQEAEPASQKHKHRSKKEKKEKKHRKEGRSDS